MPASAKPKPPALADKKQEKKKFIAIGALLTSTPFLIAIAVHALLLIGGGSVVIFKGGNPLAIFTSQEVGDGGSGAEAEAPPSPEEPMPEPESEPMPTESEVQPTETDQSSDILALSTPSTVPSFAPPAPAKVSAPSGAAGSSVKMSAAPRPVGRAGGKRTGKSTLFGFSEKMGGELEGTMYDLKLKSDGKTSTGLNDKTFPDAVKKIVRNKFRPNSLADFYRVDKKFFSTMFYIPLREAGEAPKTFGVQGKVKPNNFIIHYEGSFAAPEDGIYRFVGLGDESIIVLVDGSVKLEGNWVPFLSYAERNDRPGDSVLEFFPTIKQNESWARLREGEWINLKAGQPRKLDVLLVEQGDPSAPGGGNFAFVLLIEKQGTKYETKKRGNQTVTVLPPFLLEEPDSGMQKILRENKDKLDVDLKNALIFGTALPPSSASPAEPEPAPVPPPSAGGRTDTAVAYGSDWKDGAGATDGWENWTLRANGNSEKKSYAGFYLAKLEEKSGSEPVATEGKSFAIFADGEGFQEAAAYRGFTKPMEPNQTFSLDLITPTPKSNAGSTGSLGLTLRHGKKSDEPKDYNAGARFEFAVLEGQANYQIFDGSQPSDSGLPLSPAGLRIEFTLKSADTYDLKLSPLSGGTPVELKDRKLGGEAGSSLESLAVFNRDSEQNAFFNRLRLNP